MPLKQYKDEEETKPLTTTSDKSRISLDSVTSASTTSIALERLNTSGEATNGRSTVSSSTTHFHNKNEAYDEEEVLFHKNHDRPMEKKTRRVLWILGGLCLVGWLVALVLFLSQQSYRHPSTRPHNPAATVSAGSGKAVTLEQVLGGAWRAKQHELSWIAGATGEDGLLLEREGGSGRDYLVVEDVRSGKSDSLSMDSVSLMKYGAFKVNGVQVYPNKVWPSPDLKKVLVMSEEQRNWRHSFTGKYWIFDVARQEAEALDPGNPGARIQLASWSPQSDAIVFTRDNNMFLRRISSQHISQITRDGGSELFYGVPDWVYEEEVFAHNSATWWSEGGDFIAFLRTNETAVPEYPIQYFVSRPSGILPPPGEENYPEVRQIKYPKAGAPNPVVDLQFYDLSKEEVFKVEIDSDFPDDTRLITELVWGGKDGKLLVRETNRESDILKVALIDVQQRVGKVVRTVDINAIDGGWFEVSEQTRFIPSDPANGRPLSGYVDTVIHDGYDHLAYFTPLDNPDPIFLTSGSWEVVKAPSAIDLAQNLVYFVATKESPIQRHVYSVKLDGSDLQAISDTSKEGYYDISFSTGSGYALLSYQGPGIPWQKVVSTPSNKVDFEHQIEDNQILAKAAAEHELPIDIFQTVNFDGYDLHVVERRPPHFDDRKKYPVIFHLYGGPGSQTVDKKFTVDFQAYLASSLGYIVVTVDGRGTGFIGRKARCVIRGAIGFYEALDQIETAKAWARKKYVDAERIAIWGWSYGGFMTLKTLELDGGRTFKYGMAVAPVTDWSFYGKQYLLEVCSFFCR
jgi:dipeptidyl aminopeptidase B